MNRPPALEESEFRKIEVLLGLPSPHDALRRNFEMAIGRYCSAVSHGLGKFRRGAIPAVVADIAAKATSVATTAENLRTAVRQLRNSLQALECDEAKAAVHGSAALAMRLDLYALQDIACRMYDAEELVCKFQAGVARDIEALSPDNANKPDEGGRPRNLATDSLIADLGRAYRQHTGREPTVGWNEGAGRATKSKFFQMFKIVFEHVAKPQSDEALVKMCQRAGIASHRPQDRTRARRGKVKS